jgi:hypothetical protein
MLLNSVLHPMCGSSGLMRGGGGFHLNGNEKGEGKGRGEDKEDGC